jgi:hypothetical protein
MRAPTARDHDAAARARHGGEPRRIGEPVLHAIEPAAEQELIAHLEPDQFVAETSRPVPRALLGVRAVTALWGLRVFAIVVSLMVIYTFIEQLH